MIGRIEWRTFDDLVSCCRANLYKVRALRPDVIVGIPRSGMLPATILATSLSVPMADVHSFAADTAWKWKHEVLAGEAFAHVLLVDDSSGTGKAMQMALAKMPKGVRVSTCAVYATPEAAASLTIAFEICPKPRKFEWNFWRDGYLKNCASDMDGVLCVDPNREQRKDREKYRDFALNARPLYLPARPLGAIVTGRREEWRPETEEWLKRQGVAYGSLHMWGGDGTHPSHKAKVFGKLGLELFVESEPEQSEFIMKATKKPVLCVKSRKLYQ
jgi:hypoxanthine phosphoribosyltransferase